MTPSGPDSLDLSQFDRWLETQIASLSVDVLSEKVFTCTACPEVVGDYIIEYRGESLRFGAPKAYAFLRFIRESASENKAS
ncbi:MAG: hypothetical protein SWY16_17275 [Cyanobacteriota bacterium]|nr:hypothetical protein [Cyanobacteriota bacterium]